MSDHVDRTGQLWLVRGGYDYKALVYVYASGDASSIVPTAYYHPAVVIRTDGRSPVLTIWSEGMIYEGHVWEQDDGMTRLT